MIRPSIYLLLNLIIGIVFGQQFYSNRFAVLFVLFIVTLNIFLLFKYKNKIAIIFVFISFLGVYLGINSSKPVDNYIYNISDKDKVDITAEIIDKSSIANNSNTYIIKILSANKNDVISSNALLYSTKKLEYGNIINTQTKISKIKHSTNNYEFDSYNYYKSCNIEYKIYAKYIKVLYTNNDTNFYLKNFRDNWHNIYKNVMPAKEANFIASIVLGDKSELDSKLNQDFRSAGIAHIIAISGLHISTLAGIIMLILSKFSKNLSYIISPIIIFIYCIFTGMSPSICRATLMFAVYMFGKIIGRKYDLLSSTSISCFILLIHNPYNIYNVGFCYSFITVFAMAMLVNVYKKFPIKPNYPLNKTNKILYKKSLFFRSCITSIVVNIASKPLTIYNFYYINIVDIFANILVIPFLAILLLSSLFVSLVYVASPLVAYYIAYIPLYITKFYEYVCHITDTIPFYKIETGGISIITLFCLYLCFIILYKMIFNKKYSICFIIIGILASIGFWNSHFNNDIINLIDTNSINTIVITDDECTMINFGSKAHTQTGKYKVENFLKYKNIDTIDHIYITKANYNYIGGLFECIDDLNIKNIHILSSCNRDKMYDRLIATANYKNINVDFVKKTDIIYKDMTLEDISKYISK